MANDTSRREFLVTAAAATSLLVTRSSSAQPARIQENARLSNARRSQLTVITQPTSSDVNPRGRAWAYISEVLARAGLFFHQLETSDWTGVPKHTQIIVLAGELDLTAQQQAALTAFVHQGGAVIGIGGTSGLNAIFGIRDKRPLMEGWIQVQQGGRTANLDELPLGANRPAPVGRSNARKKTTFRQLVEQPDHAITTDLRSSLHVFGGFAVTPDAAESLATIESGRQGAKGATICEHRVGNGRAILIGPDLLFSIVHIQQGLPVLQDGTAAPDESGPINDGELKAEDGMVLDWQRDRSPMQPDGVPAFLEPITDELRTIILRSIFHAAHALHLSLPLLWYWPRQLPAVGHISHDTDGHDPQKAVALLEVMNRCQVKSTWCTLYPGGYPREFYEQLKQQGFEIALHFDARTGGTDTSWSYDNLVMQHRWLLDAAGLDLIVSNKNHYTRWEDRLDFFRWCERLGIRSDQSRGPSKQGTIGFPLGGSQPYFPWDERAGRYIPVLEVNMLTQDLVVVCPKEYGQQLLDSVLRHHGVAHFLFHPAHIEKPGVADALGELVDRGRQLGLEWWTSQQIYDWEMKRRSVQMDQQSPDSFTLQCAKPLRDASLLFLKPSPDDLSITINDQTQATTQMSFCGFDFEAVTFDLNDKVQILTS